MERAGAVGEGYGLRQHCLSPMEVLAQSIATISPSASPTLTIPLVFALAGNGTWLAYGLALVAMVLIALVVAEFARESASPGSLYVYVRKNLPPWCAVVAAWALLFAYAMTAASLLSGAVNYGLVVLGGWARHLSPAWAAVGLAALAVLVAWRDVQISARVMLWLEGVSLCLIGVVLVAVLLAKGWHVDRAQLSLQGVTASGMRLGVVLAIFSFVGFESATTLGAEAREPLRTIPRAVVRSAVLCGFFFVLCVYGEVLGFGLLRQGGAAAADLGTSTAPMRTLAERAGMPVVGRLIDVGAMVSMFAGTLACLVAAARVVLQMAQHGLTHARLGRVSERRATPGVAGLAAGAMAAVPVAVLLARGATAADVFGWTGTLATYGFLTVYGMVAVALPVFLGRRGRQTAGRRLLAVAAGGAVLVAAVGTVVPLPPAPFRYFPYLYVAYLLVGCGWCWWMNRAVGEVDAVSAVPAVAE